MKKILLTTTESLFGWEIESYLKPIFSNVVIGAGFLSDFSASFTDLFGGRSNSYERKLQSVNDSALQILQSKASELGATCVIGLKVNVHQISGKNVQMFMVSAYGTAVIAKSTITIKVSTSSKEIDKSTVNERAKLIELQNKFTNDDFQLKLEDLQLIVDNHADDFISIIYNKLKKQVSADYGMETEVDKLIERLYIDYFSVINSTNAKTILYHGLQTEDNTKFLSKILTIIKAFDLVDYQYCINMLEMQSVNIRKLALQVLSFDKPFYVVEDSRDLRKIIAIIEVSFPNSATSSTKKGFLSSNEKEVWVCKCSRTNDLSEEFCGTCCKDQKGFKENEITPAVVIKHLTNIERALKESFNLTE